MGDQQILNLLRRDILAIANDDILDPARDDQMVAVDPCTLVAGAIIAVGVEAGFLILPVEIAHHHLRSARADFAIGRDANGGDAGTAIGVGGMIAIGRVDHADSGDGQFGGAIDAADDRLVEIGGSVADQAWRNRCAAADEELKVGQACPGCARRGQQML